MIATILLVSGLLLQDQMQAPVLAGFKLGTRKVKQYPDNGGYQVFQENGRIRVLTRVKWVEWDHEHRPHSYPTGTVKVIEPRAYREFLTPNDGVSVSSGRLYAVDHGEWGGGIYYVPANRKSHQRISDRNTDCLAAFGKDIFAFQSLAHMTFWYADLVRVERVGGKWQTHVVKSFTEAPREVQRDGDHFVLLGFDEVLTLKPDGSQRQLLNIKAIGENYYCMTILSNHQIWLGSDSGVMCLVPRKDGTYEHFSYIPS